MYLYLIESLNIYEVQYFDRAGILHNERRFYAPTLAEAKKNAQHLKTDGFTYPDINSLKTVLRKVDKLSDSSIQIIINNTDSEYHIR